MSISIWLSFKPRARTQRLLVPKWELMESVTRARRGQWPRTPPVYLYEVLGSAPPLAKEGERVSGGEDSGARPAEGSIGLNSIWVKLTQRSDEQRTRAGEVRVRDAPDSRFRKKRKTWTFSSLYLYFKRKGPRWIFFTRAEILTVLTRSWCDKSPKWPSSLGKLTNVPLSECILNFVDLNPVRTGAFTETTGPGWRPFIFPLNSEVFHTLSVLRDDFRRRASWLFSWMGFWFGANSLQRSCLGLPVYLPRVFIPPFREKVIGGPRSCHADMLTIASLALPPAASVSQHAQQSD